MRNLLAVSMTILLTALSAPASAELSVQRVTDGVFAIVGDIGNRSPENLGNNATFGAVVTDAGVVLVDPGGTRAGAEALQAAVATVTDKPIVRVINTGGQDHRWLGNGHFRALGATIVASSTAVADQRERAEDQLIGLRTLLGDALIAGTEPTHADITFEDTLDFVVGGTRFELRHVGPAHTPGDILVWLPRQRVVFTGDVVYTERLLGVIGVSSSRTWLEAFAAVSALQPQHLVPGHGRPTTLARAAADTEGYLRFLRDAVRAHMDAGGDISRIGTIDQSRYAHLANYEQLAGRNAQKVFSELEWE